MNSWQTLKSLHPSQLIFLYVMGPAEYDLSPWAVFTEGWTWMTTNHGLGTADPWVERGFRANVMLQNPSYAEERLMLPANPRWQAYWADRAYTLVFNTPAPGSMGADGIFADNTTAECMPNWYQEGTTIADTPQTYTAAGGTLRQDVWRSDILAAMQTAVRSLATHRAGLVPNYGYMGRPANNWDALDALASPPVIALQEDGFVSPYGPGNVFHSWDYDAKVREFARLRVVRAMFASHGFIHAAPATRDAALAQMAERDANGESGWDALWFSIGTFLLGFDDVRGNGYHSFSIWDYTSRVIYFDEYDPRHLHLGRARGGLSVTSAGLYVREFDDGWIVVNPTLFTRPPSGMSLTFAVPTGMARVVTHDNLGSASSAPLVASAAVSAGRGVIFLKAGRAIDDSDNPPIVMGGDAGVDGGDAAVVDAAMSGDGAIASDAATQGDAPSRRDVLESSDVPVDARGVGSAGGCACRSAPLRDKWGARGAWLIGLAVSVALRRRERRAWVS
jgi:hypothetical protein